MERRRREGGQSRDRLEDVRKRGTGEGLGARAKDIQKGGKDGHLECVGPARHTHGYARVIVCSVHRRLTQLVRLVIGSCEPL
jgi:hypothetical protein